MASPLLPDGTRLHDRNTRLQYIRVHLDSASADVSCAAQALMRGDHEQYREATAKARAALESAQGLLQSVDGICDVHMRPVHRRVNAVRDRLRLLAEIAFE